MGWVITFNRPRQIFLIFGKDIYGRIRIKNVPTALFLCVQLVHVIDEFVEIAVPHVRIRVGKVACSGWLGGGRVGG